MRRWPSSLRARLTFWYMLVLGAPLIAFAAGSYAVFARALLTRTDHFVADALSAFARELTAERMAGSGTSLTAIRTTVAEVRFRDLRIMVLDDAARVLASGTPAEGPVADTDAARSIDARRVVESGALGRREDTATFAITIHDSTDAFRVHARPVVLRGERYRLVAVYPLRDTSALLAGIRRAFLIGVPLLLVSAAAGGYVVAKRSLAPLSAMSAQATAISASTLHERLPVAGAGDELTSLATVINELLDRIERAFAQQRRFMADASHELRTPAAILRTEVEVTLARAHRPEREYRESAEVMLDAAHRLTRIVDDLFLLARADAGHLVVRREEVYLDEIVHSATRAVRALAAEHRVHVALRGVVDAPMQGDGDLLGRLLLNLLDNAIKYSPPDGTVDVELTERGGRYEITVVDAGPGIPDDARERVFERFFRVDVARSREDGTMTSGAGLGLSIARRVAEAHAGRLELVASRPGRTEFRVTLPADRGAPTAVRA